MGKRVRTYFAALAALVGVLAWCPPSPAEETEATSSDGSCPLLSPQEIAFRFAYGIADKSLRFYTFGPRVAYDLPGLIPAIFGNRIRIAIEATGSIINGDHHPRDGEFAFSPLIFDYRYDAGGVFVPFIEGGEGIVLTTLQNVHIGGPFEFSSQGGGGFYLFYAPEDAVSFDFRIRHISNSGIKDENSGLNTYFFTIGLSHFPGRK